MWAQPAFPDRITESQRIVQACRVVFKPAGDAEDQHIRLKRRRIDFKKNKQKNEGGKNKNKQKQKQTKKKNKKKKNKQAQKKKKSK